MTRQTWPSRIMNNSLQHDNNKYPTLRDSKPSQADLKQLKIWNISSLVWTLNTSKVVSHEKLLGVRYSLANVAFVKNEKLTIAQNMTSRNGSE